jgi:hypothetical protein
MSKPRTNTNTLAFPKLPPRRRRLKITREHRRRVENAVEAMINFLNEVDDVEAEGADDDHPIDDDELEGGDDGKEVRATMRGIPIPNLLLVRAPG